MVQKARKAVFTRLISCFLVLAFGCISASHFHGISQGAGEFHGASHHSSSGEKGDCVWCSLARSGSTTCVESIFSLSPIALDQFLAPLFQERMAISRLLPADASPRAPPAL
ncbi:MAG: DUF2946 family protein [Bdellovibrionales bacterium]|nr:DUF2946 family protein [Bdellovibrionales bacterium]